MMRPEPLAEILDGAAESCRLTSDLTDWSLEDCGVVLDAVGVVAYEIVGLSARIRVARAAKGKPPTKVNDARRPVPMKPGPKKAQDPPSPSDDPPADPPKDGAR